MVTGGGREATGRSGLAAIGTGWRTVSDMTMGVCTHTVQGTAAVDTVGAGCVGCRSLGEWRTEYPHGSLFMHACLYDGGGAV